GGTKRADLLPERRHRVARRSHTNAPPAARELRPWTPGAPGRPRVYPPRTTGHQTAPAWARWSSRLEERPCPGRGGLAAASLRDGQTHYQGHDLHDDNGPEPPCRAVPGPSRT